MRAALWMMAGLLAAPLVAEAQPAPRPPADPIAVVVRVTGNVRVQVGAAPPAPARPGLRLRAGDRLNVPTGAQAVLLYRTGRSQTVTQSIRVQAPRGAAGAGVFQQTIRTLNEVSSTDARALPNRQGMIRPIAGSPVPVSPRNLVALVGTRPGFTWTQVPEATAYLLQVRDLEGGPLMRFPLGTDTTYTLPDSLPELARGHTYEWSVARVDGGRAAPPQRFRIATQAELDSVGIRLEQLRGIGLDPDGDGAFLAAVIYRDAGLLHEALAALDRVEVSGGGTGAEFRRMRGEIYAQLGMLDRALEDFTAADAEEF